MQHADARKRGGEASQAPGVIVAHTPRAERQQMRSRRPATTELDGAQHRRDEEVWRRNRRARRVGARIAPESSVRT
eukprot:7391655-Prymnesium_polylepis.2